MYTPHVLVSFGGTLREMGGDDEIWQCGIRCSVEAGFDEHTYVGEIAAPLVTWFQAGTSMHSNWAKLGWIKAAQIGADGRYPSTTYAPAHALIVPTMAGGGATQTMPAFCSVAYSWKASTHPRGPAANGRVYPPNYAAPLVYGSSVIADDTATTLVGAAQQLLAVVQNELGTQHTSPGIFSKIGGAAGNITSVKIGNVVDTQTRRKRKVPERYQAGTYPP
jgi:hypothetical protein